MQKMCKIICKKMCKKCAQKMCKKFATTGCNSENTEFRTNFSLVHNHSPYKYDLVLNSVLLN